MLRDGLRRALLEEDAGALAGLAEDWLDRAPGCLKVEVATLQPRFAPASDTSCCLLVQAVLDALDIARQARARARVRQRALPRPLPRHQPQRQPPLVLDGGCGARAKAQAYYRRRRRDGGP